MYPKMENAPQKVDAFFLSKNFAFRSQRECANLRFVTAGGSGETFKDLAIWAKMPLAFPRFLSRH